MEIATAAAPNVDLFRAIWAVDPSARFYGGTSRDFLWYVRRRLAVCRNVACIDRVARLLATETIDVREFLVGESDVDTVTAMGLSDVAYDATYLRRLEAVSPEWLTPGTPLFFQEERQGGLPIEKILLGAHGFVPHPVASLRGGESDVYHARPRVVVDERIRDTAMFREHQNHPLLLAVRWLRQTAVAFYQRFGRKVPTEAELEAVSDANAVTAVEKVLAEARGPKALEDFADDTVFRKRLLRQLKRLFRSYTCPEAALALYERFGVSRALEAFEGRLEPFLNVLFRKYRDPDKIAANRARLPLAGSLLMPVREWARRQGLELVDGRLPLFHGAGSLSAYRSISFEGILPSVVGLAGEGPYAVDLRSLSFSQGWSQSRAKTSQPLVAELAIDGDAILLDLTDPRSAELERSFAALGVPGGGAFEDELADFLGADLLRYPYDDVHAYVAKNGDIVRSVSAAPGSPRPMRLPEAREYFARHQNDEARLAEALAIDPSLEAHLHELLLVLPPKERPARHLALLGNAKPIAKVKAMAEYARDPEMRPAVRAAGNWSRVVEDYFYDFLRGNTYGNAVVRDVPYFVRLLGGLGDPKAFDDLVHHCNSADREHWYTGGQPNAMAFVAESDWVEMFLEPATELPERLRRLELPAFVHLGAVARLLAKHRDRLPPAIVRRLLEDASVGGYAHEWSRHAPSDTTIVTQVYRLALELEKDAPGFADRLFELARSDFSGPDGRDGPGRHWNFQAAVLGGFGPPATWDQRRWTAALDFLRVAKWTDIPRPDLYAALTLPPSGFPERAQAVGVLLAHAVVNDPDALLERWAPADPDERRAFYVAARKSLERVLFRQWREREAKVVPFAAPLAALDARLDDAAVPQQRFAEWFRRETIDLEYDRQAQVLVARWTEELAKRRCPRELASAP